MANFFEKIQSNRKYLNESEESLLDYMFHQKVSLKKMTIRQIANENFTAPNAIIRLCKKLGFSGFVEFREAYCNEISQGDTFLSVTSLDEQIIKTKQLMNDELVHQVLEQMYKSKKILFFAVGLSRIVAEELHQRFATVGKNSHIFIDPHVMYYNAKLMEPGDIAIAISISGETSARIRAIEIAKSFGASTISITGFSKNTLSQLTDFQFYAMTSETYVNDIDVSDRLGLYYISNYLFREYVNHYCMH